MDAFADLESRHTEILFPSRVVVQTGPIDPRAPFCLAKPVCLGESVLRPIQRAPQVRGRPDTFRTPVGHVEAGPSRSAVGRTKFSVGHPSTSKLRV